MLNNVMSCVKPRVKRGPPYLSPLRLMTRSLMFVDAAPLPPELLELGAELADRSAIDGTIEENFEEELASAPQVYAEVSAHMPAFTTACLIITTPVTLLCHQLYIYASSPY